jgi:hypothetical protein
MAVASPTGLFKGLLWLNLATGLFTTALAGWGIASRRAEVAGRRRAVRAG